MSICEDRITEDSTEFEKAFLKIYDGSLWNTLDKMKDWQPPKPLVVVPQIVADYIETQKGNVFDRVGTLAYGHYKAVNGDEEYYEFNEWIAYNFDTFLEAIVNGYTVEKEKLFYLKSKMTGRYLRSYTGLGIDDTTLRYEEVDDRRACGFGGGTTFTQSEIDDMETGSYEQIPVEMSDNGI